MAIRGQLSFGGQALQRLERARGMRALAELGPDRARIADEETAVDVSAASLRLLVALVDQLSADAKLSKTSRRTDGRHRGDLAVASMKGDQRGDVDVRDAIAISEQKEVVVLDVLADCGDAPAGLGSLPRLREHHIPVFLRGRDRHGDVPLRL